MRKIITGIILSTLALSTGCGNDKTNGNGNGADKILPVEVGAARQTEWLDEVVTYGTIKAPDRVDILPRVAGKLVRLLVKEEQAVKADEVVAIVERDEIGLTFKPVEVKSTVDGRIETLYFKEGAKVNEMAPIMAISKQSELKLVVNLFETDLARIKPGLESIIMMDALPDKEFTGKVTLIKPTIDAMSNKGVVEISLDGNHPEVMFGMFGRARIIIGRRPALTIAPEALRKISGRDAVYVVADNTAKLVYVETGARKPDMVEISKGLNNNDTIITFASDEMKDGSRIKIMKEQK